MNEPARNLTKSSLMLSALTSLSIFAVSPAHSIDAGLSIVPPLGKVCYVNASASGGTGDGSSWANAYAGASGVQNALTNLASSNCTQIWVAKGAYRPGSRRTDTFQLVSGVALYGGFSGTEGALNDRDPLVNTTMLSGDIGTLDTETDNVYHVVTGSGVNNTAVLDGFTVAFGFADGSSFPHNLGGGLYIDHGSPTIRNVTIRGNHALHGGGAYIAQSTPSLWGVIFDSNTAFYGAGLNNHFSDVELGNATFVNNTAGMHGGAIVNNASEPTFIHLTITRNSALETGSLGGGMYNVASHPRISNSILWGNTAGENQGAHQIYNDRTSATSINHSVIEGGYGGTNVITENPFLGYLENQGGRMQVLPIRYDSSARDAADSDDCPYVDQRGLNRPQGGGCDIGAHEFQDVIYVVPGGRVSGLCNSWTFACDLQYALKEAFYQAAQQLWVKAGTYKPFSGADRAATFSIGRGEQIYGGFAGTETSLGQRDYQGRVTTLSGDLNSAAVTDNAYHVVTNDRCHLDGELTPVTILDGLTITGGYADGGGENDKGGGLYSSGCAVLKNLIIKNNYAAYLGGGVWNGRGEVVIENTTIASNQAASSGGGISNDKDASLVLSNVNLIQNRASSYGGGIFTYNRTSLTDITLRQNSAPSGGGGLYIQYDGENVELSRVVFDRNSTESRGGGLFFVGNSGGKPTLSDVTFVGNTAIETEKDLHGLGGGMMMLIIGNSPPLLTRLTFQDNRADKGGGLYYSAGDVHQPGLDLLSSATFVGNTAGVSGGGMVVGGVTGLMSDLTMQDNAALLLAQSLHFFDGSLEIRNSIFWGDTPGAQITNASDDGKVVVSTGVVKGGYEHGSNITVDDPLLGTLSDNGGFTDTVPLLEGSPAIDQSGFCLETDQRGIKRPQGKACDIGAFEFAPNAQSPGTIFSNGFE